MFWRGGALSDLYQATIAYNLQYSGETYAGRWDLVRYLLTFPIRHARVDALWFARRARLRRPPRRGCAEPGADAGAWPGFPSSWVAAACLSIAINGSRDLPQYFLQAAPALALAAGSGGGARRAAAGRPAARCDRRAAGSPSRSGASARRSVSQSSRPTSGTTRSTCSAGSTGATHLARYGGARDSDKYSALGNGDIGDVPRRAHGAGRDGLRLRLLAGALRLRRSAQRLAVLLEPPGDRRLPRRAIRATASTACGRISSAPAGVSSSCRSATGARRAGLGAVLHVAAALADWLRDDYRPAAIGVDGFEAWERDAPMTRAAIRRLGCSAIALLAAVAARTVSIGRSAVAVHGRRRVARRRRVGAQRAEQGAVRRMAPGRVEPGVHRAGLHGARVRRRSRPSASASGRRGWCAKSPASLSVLLLALGVRRLAGDRAGLIAGALLATNYVYVMYNRAAIMEAPMAAFIVASWYCYVARGAGAPLGRARGGSSRLLAFFTKAAAAFFVGALALATRSAGRAWNAGAGSVRSPPTAPPVRPATTASRSGERALDARRARGVLRHRRARCSSCRTGTTTGSTTGRCP